MTKDAPGDLCHFPPPGRCQVASLEDKIHLVVDQKLKAEKDQKGARMTNTATYDETRAGEEHHCYSWLENYLERLAGKDAYREFQESFYDTPEYCTLVTSLAA